jgi:hypothetical protein
VEGWGQIPEGWLTYDVAGVGVDERQRVYLFNRGEHPLIVLDSAGRFLNAWGDAHMFPRAHAITMGADETIWLTDSGDHTVRKCSLEGEVLMTLGMSGRAAPAMSGRPFNQCTHVAIHPRTEEIFVSDGYGNAKVHKYAPDGRHLMSWGEAGNEPGQFNLPHNISIDRDGYVYVADRHNARVQVFTQFGELVAVWTGMALPCGMYLDVRDPEQLCYIGELSSAMWAVSGSPFECWNRPGMGPRISIYTLDGVCRAKLLDNGPGEGTGQLIAPHGVAVDASGSIYIGECSWLMHGSRLDPPRQVRNIQKLVRVRAAD